MQFVVPKAGETVRLKPDGDDLVVLEVTLVAFVRAPDGSLLNSVEVSKMLCRHNYGLMDSCPNCDAE